MDALTSMDGQHFLILFTCLVSAVSVLLFLKKRTVHSPSSSQSGRSEIMFSKNARKLGPFESILYELNTNTMEINCYMAFVESRTPLTLDLLEQAASVLQRRHPQFQVRVLEDEDANGRSYYFVPMEDLVVDVDEVETECWEDVHAMETKTPLNFSRGPLWRMRLLRSKDKNMSEDGLYKNIVATTFSHAIVDGNCIMRVLNELMDILSALSNGDDIDTSSYPRLPSVEELVNIEEYPWWKKIIAKSLFKISKLFKSRKVNPYIERFQTEISRNPSVVKETRALSIEFTEDEVKKLRNICRQHGATVNGATTAAASIAICKIMQGGKLSRDQKIPTSLAVNMRKYCTPQPDPNKSVGLYISGMKQEIKVSKNGDSSAEFWELAAKCTKETRYKCRNNGKEGRNFLQLISFFIKVLKLSLLDALADDIVDEQTGRSEELFLMSNLGDLSYFTKSAPREFELVKRVSACSGFKWEPTFAHYIATLHGKMFWSLAYHTNVCTKSQAQEYADTIEEVLMMVIND
ncbi:uncharacterized protein [Ptychodera flava]|uniref:uncharacterized protein n=1 Tax=Ptychodera flava TaxID=63121 RepID=UPI00396A7AED